MAKVSAAAQRARVAFDRIDRLRPDIPLAEIEGPHFLPQTCPGHAATAIMNFLRDVKAG